MSSMSTWSVRPLAAALLCLAGASGAAPTPPEAVVDDWILQDGLVRDGELQVDAVGRPIEELGPAHADLRAAYDRLRREQVAADDGRWLALYRQACHRRRAARLGPDLDAIGRVVFTKHYNLGGSHYAYTEGQSDAQAERHFVPGSALCLLEMDGLYGTVRTLLEDPGGVIRDPDVSWDGRRILFAWKKSLDRDDYHLYEMTVADRAVRQLTEGLGAADYEGCYLPGGEIVFNSTRCVQTVDCYWTEVSNLYACDGDGRRLRRLGYDQVHTNFPTVMPDGCVLYTRWDYSDRGQIFPQGLFQMNPDGTGQREYYGNNSWFPTTILHARAIPGTRKVVAIFTGHHTHQRGQLGLLDPSRGRQENQGAQLIAPTRDTPADRIDAYGQQGPQFQYPYPIRDTTFLVTMDPVGSPNRRYDRPYAIYWIDVDGRRELLASDPGISCNQPIPLRPRPRAHLRPSVVDHGKASGTYYVQDVYAGAGLAGVPRGTVKRLRVVAIAFRAAGIRCNYSMGPAGRALASTPVSIGNGCWDPKTIVGDATVYADGSAWFEVPARTPLYFQALDARGHAVQTMRSWSTLQPGEATACVGCHESKNSAPRPEGATLALGHGPQKLAPFFGPPRGFSFAQEIQPILDKHCIGCHDDRTRQLAWNRDVGQTSPDEGKAFSLLRTTTVEEQSGRRWSDAYLALTGARRTNIRPDLVALLGEPNRLVDWISAQSEPTMLAPYSSGAARSGLIALLENGHGGVELNREEADKIAAWIDLLVPYCGDYIEANAWTEAELAKYRHFLDKRRRMEPPEGLDGLEAR